MHSIRAFFSAKSPVAKNKFQQQSDYEQRLLSSCISSPEEMAAALVGCVAGAALVEETRDMLDKAGFTTIVLTPKPSYVHSMQDWNDPLYKQIAETLPKGEEMADYVVSLDIEARK
jgi:hypothetical protein